MELEFEFECCGNLTFSHVRICRMYRENFSVLFTKSPLAEVQIHRDTDCLDSVTSSLRHQM